MNVDHAFSGYTAEMQCPDPCPAKETEWNHSCTEKFRPLWDDAPLTIPELILAA